ncbi:MAG: FtsX-like permease family protein [Steroidobacteraceae bacterium]
MLRHYLAAALRHLDRHRLYAVVNVGALALALAAALLIGLYVRDELSFDRWIPAHDRIHRVAMGIGLGNTQLPPSAGTAPQIAAWLLEDFPQIEVSGRLRNARGRIQVGANESDVAIAWSDAELQDVLALPKISGDVRAALERPDGAVLTQETARRLYGREDVLDQTLTLDGKSSFRIGAVLRDLPAQTHFAFEVLLSARSAVSPLVPRDAPLQFMNQSFDEFASALTYLRLRPGADPRRLDEGLQVAMEKHVTVPRGPDGKPLVPTPRLYLQGLADIHFVPAGANAMKPAGSRELLLALSGTGALILVIAIVNFINLTTAYGDSRSLEVAMRRVAGATRAELALQFIGESALQVGCAATLAAALVEWLQPQLGAILGRSIAEPWWQNAASTLQIAGFTVAIAVVAGLYPALVLTRPAPAPGLRCHGAGVGGIRLRRGLVAVQFAILTLLLIGVIVVDGQSSFAVRTGLGFRSENLVVIDSDCRGSFVAELKRLPGIKAAACSDSRFGIGGGGSAVSTPAGSAVPLLVTFVAAQTGLLELAGLAPVAGRFDLDGDGVVINQAAVSALGLRTAAEAVGRSARFLSDDALRIVGVAPDFALQGIGTQIQPMVFRNSPQAYRYVIAQMVGANPRQTLVAIDALWKRSGHSGPIHRELLDHAIQRTWRDLRRQAGVLAGFTAVAVTIAALGLFGLSAQLARRRSGEIAVRKALGAGTPQVLRLLLVQFARPAIWANVLAWPIAAWVMDRWLHGFIYRIELRWWMFALASLASLAIAVMAGAMHALRTARLRPAVVLREL